MANPEVLPETRELSAAAMIRRGLFLLLLIGLSFFYLWIDFSGLTHAMGMDQAQISREIAAGNGFTTKMVRPVALYQVNERQKEKYQAAVQDGDDEISDSIPLVGFPDTYHAPLNPLFNAILISFAKDEWDYDGESAIYYLDYIIAGGAIVLLLCSVGVSYLLVARIFDARIAGVTAVLMILCALLWDLARTGLPHMLMLFLFSFALYFLYKALENAAAEKNAYLWAVLAGGFFGLLALAHWITIWIFVGALLFATLAFRPRGVLAVVMFAVFSAVVGFWLVRNYQVSGHIEGSARYLVWAGLPGQSESQVMRNADPENEQFSFNGIIVRTVENSLTQTNDLYRFLGSIVVAPLFFLSLLHPFRRREIADFRWCILLMWLFGVLGMAIFGIDSPISSNNIHVLFIPIMTAYGLAFLSILWNRLNLPMHIPAVRGGHFILAIALSALPLLLTFPTDLKRGLFTKERRTNWPPYSPPSIQQLVKSPEEAEGGSALVHAHEVVVSDMPWAVAWYGDRISLWLPRNLKQFNSLYSYASAHGTPLAGIFLTPVTTNEELGYAIIDGEFKPWSPLIVRGAASAVDDVAADFAQDFPFPAATPLGQNYHMVYFTDAARLRAAFSSE